MEEKDFIIRNGTLERYEGKENDVVIPDCVTEIDQWAFERCWSIEKIAFPAGVTRVNALDFDECTSLADITVDSKNPKYRSENNCLIEKETNTLVLGGSNSIIPIGITSIGEFAFRNRQKLKNVTIPDGVISIGEHAFRGCYGIESIVIPESVTEIGGHASYDDGAFSYCTSLESITVDSQNPKYRSENNCLIEKETNMLILGCKNSIIPDGVTCIGKFAFSGCEGLTSITIPDGVTDIGKYAFMGCKNLVSITIPGSVTSMDSSAFGGCEKLVNVTFKGTTEQFNSVAEDAVFGDSVANEIVCSDDVVRIER